jgi:hypothetical protein
MPRYRLGASRHFDEIPTSSWLFAPLRLQREVKQNMGKPHVPHASAETAQSATYQPALNAHARQLIARIQRDPVDTEAVLALKAHYEAHGDLPSLVNLMQGWAETLREPEAAADAYVAAAEAALSVRDRYRARWLCEHALKRSPQHERARAQLDALDEAARSVPPPPPRRASANAAGSKPPPPISQIRSIDGDAVWLDDDDLQPLEGAAVARAGKYEETQRIWRTRLS